MQNNNLNLARKWRSKNFDQIIGQDLAIRILKNGLYLNSFFPVYLFAGQRGCGKTTTARVFAAAVNCQVLTDFQKDAKSFMVPCLQCNSCISIAKGKHPDFIEIDAASHTGVDNIRNIIDASSFLPLIGRKKIYLIDEAHMLSKAAFNAFLKILEEPPASVIFILATTDVQKIIDTVRSRCFQLFFTSISHDVLIKHLEEICKKESIEYEIDGLQIIAKESEGSARDAINLLEQIRFAHPCVNKHAVLNTLGHLSDEYLLLIFEQLIYKKNTQRFLNIIEDSSFYSYSADFIWNKLLELFSFAIRIKFGVSINSSLDIMTLNKIVSSAKIENITFALEEFCKNEIVFFKSINKSLFLELLCLRIINTDKNFNIESRINNPIIEAINMPKRQQMQVSEKSELIPNKTSNLWEIFLQEIKNINDPMLESVLLQAKFIKFDESSGEVIISYNKQFIFFKDLIDENINNWLPSLKKIFKINAVLKINFEENENIIVEKTKVDLHKQSAKIEIKKNNGLDLTDKEKWKMTNELLKHFPGSITQMETDLDE